MKSIGIKLADGSFYPLLEEGNPEKRTLDLTTVMDNQTKVQVEVYRTDTGSLENAEYLDTLEIKNLKPHENGEPTLCLAIDLDENNELSAEIRDPETGKKSDIQVVLQSRTLAGLDGITEDEDNDVTISDDDLEKAGLDDFVEKKESDEIPLPEEDFSFDDVNAPAQADLSIASEENAEEDIFGENSLDLPDFGSSTDEPDEDIFTEESSETLDSDTLDSADSGNSIEENEISDIDFSTDDETFVDVDSEEKEEEIDVPVADNTETSDDQLNSDLPDFDESMFDLNAEETVSEDTSDDTLNFEEEESDTTIVEGLDIPQETEENSLSMDLPDFDDEETVFEENSSETTTDETFSLPDFDDEETDNSTDLDLPDFDDLEATNLDTESSDSSIFDFPDDSLTDSSEDFTLPPDFDTDTGDNDVIFDEQPKNPTFAPSNNMFSNLYDKETLEGTSSSYSLDEENDDVRKKTRVPVIICIICAIICILAALLTLFVIPSKLNIFSRNKTETVIVENNEVIEEEIPIVEEPKEEPAVEVVVKEETAPAKEDAIVVAETPAAVVPAAPEPVPEKLPDIRYKIKWGDTLWDISNAYYKTPWKYKKIAKYNKIRNPDRIISGRYILIPAE